MAADELLGRVRDAFSRRRSISEKRMFGGHCFFASGNMIGGVTGHGGLIIRVGAVDYLRALQHPHAREMDFTGRPMRGFVVVDEAGFASDEDLKFWLDWGHAFAKSLPPKRQ
jgi:TfoX N-terminal domain